MGIPIKEYASSTKQSYSKVWREYTEGKLGGYKNDGKIFIGEHPATRGDQTIPNQLNLIPLEQLVINLPLDPEVLSEHEAKASSRTNLAHKIKPTDRFTHISNGIDPFHSFTADYGGSSDVSIKDAIVLTQKAYYNFSIFRSTVDLLSDFSVGKIHFRGGNKNSREFFTNYWKHINLFNLQEVFYKELYRSGNNFFWRIDGKIRDEDIKKLINAYSIIPVNDAKIPVQYNLLNPADIVAYGNISFSEVQYYKVLTDYELERLRNPRTIQDEEVLNSLPKEVQKEINGAKRKASLIIKIPLDNKNLIAIFYKKQPYEPFAVPMAYATLEDLNMKKSLKYMDEAISRTISQAILLVKVGEQGKDGRIIFNQKTVQALQKIFENESVGRVLVTDWTVNMEFIIPQISDILDPKKYQIVDKDIALGFSNVLFMEGEKFSNQHAKVELFLETIKHNRQIFLENFLIPETKRIGKILGFKSIPEPEYEDLDLKNDLEYSKLYVRMMELGILTNEEGIKAIETGQLPSSEEMDENQAKFKKQRDSGLFKPLATKDPLQAGRPSGTKAPKKPSSRTGPIGGSTKFSLEKIKENLVLAGKLEESIKSELKKQYKVKKLSQEQTEVISELTNLIIANETPDQWNNKTEDYIKNPIDRNKDRINEMHEIAYDHQVDSFLAGILLNSKVDEPNN